LTGPAVSTFTAWWVDIATYLPLTSIYTTTTSPFTSGPLTTPVSLPAEAVLLVSSLAGLAALRRRRRAL